MRRAELERAIEQPAARVGLRLEDGLTETVLDDAAAASGSLPLIGHALMETWLRRRGTLLRLEGFRSAGGVIGAMTQRADAFYRQLDPAADGGPAAAAAPAGQPRRRHAGRGDA